MKYIRLGLFVCIGLLLVTAPIYAAGIVPACAPDCKACDFVQLGQNIISWFIKVAASVIAITFAWGGAKMVMSGGDTGAVSSARSMMTNAVVGFMILMAGYLIVDTVLKLFLNDQSYGVWNKVQCTVAPPSTTGTTPNVVGTPSGQGPVTTAPAGCPTCTSIPSNIPTNGNACNAGSTCQLRPEMAIRLTGVDLSKEGLRVSEAWPPTGYSASKPTGVHASACHGNATCVDVSYNTNNPDGSQIQEDIQKFKSNNLTAVYEVKTQERQSELKQAGVQNVIVVAGINREHFSVYACDLDASANACKK